VLSAADLRTVAVRRRQGSCRRRPLALPAHCLKRVLTSSICEVSGLAGVKQFLPTPPTAPYSEAGLGVGNGRSVPESGHSLSNDSER
jgi:hypothetical protein